MTWPNIPPTYPIMTLTYMIPILVAVVFLTLIERKILNYMQSWMLSAPSSYYNLWVMESNYSSKNLSTPPHPHHSYSSQPQY